MAVLIRKCGLFFCPTFSVFTKIIMKNVPWRDLSNFLNAVLEKFVVDHSKSYKNYEKNTNLVTIADGLLFWLWIIGNSELLERIKVIFFQHLKVTNLPKRTNLWSWRNTWSERDEIKPSRFTSRLINCYLWVLLAVYMNISNKMDTL